LLSDFYAPDVLLSLSTLRPENMKGYPKPQFIVGEPSSEFQVNLNLHEGCRHEQSLHLRAESVISISMPTVLNM
jgi:hypothetical protein